MAQARASEPLQPPGWAMPLVPENYDRSPLTSAEITALDTLARAAPHRAMSKASTEARTVAARLLRPLEDVWWLRRKNQSHRAAFRRFMLQQMLERAETFWEWSQEEWAELLCPTNDEFIASYGNNFARTPALDTAYLLCHFDRLRELGGGIRYALMARDFFGAGVLGEQRDRLKAAITEAKGLGYSSNPDTDWMLFRSLSLLALQHRNPYLEAFTPEGIEEASATAHPDIAMDIANRVTVALVQLEFMEPAKPPKKVPARPSREGVTDEWYEWALAWRRQVQGDLVSEVGDDYLRRVLEVGRWLAVNRPEVTSPEQWTEELALEYRADLSRQVVGEYAGARWREILTTQGKAGQPIKPPTITAKLVALRRFFIDLQNRPHHVHLSDHTLARKIPLRFKPTEVLALPRATRLAREDVEPRDIDPVVWRKLAGAAARLGPEDVRRRNWPLSAIRALALLWVTTARRPNELLRLRVDCIRREWEPGMVDEDGEPLEPGEEILSGEAAEQHRLDGSTAADAEAAERQLEMMKREPAPVPPNADFLTNPQGLSDERIEELAEEGSDDALRQLTLVVESLRSSVAEREQNSDGRNAIVGAMRKRLTFVERQLERCHQHKVMQRR